MRPRSVTVIGILSIVLGAIQALGIPLAVFIANVWMPYLRSVSPAAPAGSDVNSFLTLLLGNIHWVDPNIAVVVAIFIDILLIFFSRPSIRAHFRPHAFGSTTLH